MSVRLKRICALCFLFVFLFMFSASALSTSTGNSSTVYSTPLEILANVNSSTFTLTPSLRSNTSQVNTENSVIGLTDRFITRSYVNVIDHSTPTMYQSWRELNYFLKMELQSASANFEMHLTANPGAYNFVSYDVPYIVVPTGYVVTVSGSYTMYEVDNTSSDLLYRTITLSGTYFPSQSVPLLMKQYLHQGATVDILGNVLISNYDVTLSFTQIEDNGGTRGFYTFNSVLSLPSEDLYEQIAAHDGYLEYYCDDVSIIGTYLVSGVSTNITVDAITFVDVDDYTLDYYFNYANEDVVVYNFASDSWYSVETNSPDGEFTASAISVRQLHFANDLDQCFDVTSDGYSEFREWFLANTVYSEASFFNVEPSTGSLIGNTNGLFVSYLGLEDPNVLTDYALRQLYNTGVSVGAQNGIGAFTDDYTGWLGTAVSGFMDVQIFPNFTFGGLFGVIIAILLAILFLKFFAGG